MIILKAPDTFDESFWAALDILVSNSKIIIDRPKGTKHPRYLSYVYPVDYGYLEGTASMDGARIDIWVGTAEHPVIDAIICIVDLAKRDSEIKLLFGCTDLEKSIIYKTHNATQEMKGILICRSIRKGEST